ncbi:MAG: PQQ-dependent sugar dehydrogenase [Nocardioidaceae bacterium]
MKPTPPAAATPGMPTVQRVALLLVVPALVAVLGSASACTAPEDVRPTTPRSSPRADEPSATERASEGKADLTPEVVARGLEVPWGIDFLPDGSALVAERASAQIQRVVPGRAVTRVGSVPGVRPTSEGGLLGLAVSPSYAKDQTIFVYYTTDRDNRVARMTYDGKRLGRPDPILTGIPAGEIHDGGRIAFGPDGMLYVTTGESGDESLAQNPDSLGGKILRIEPDGDVPPDNPDPDSPVWTLGHRNIEGITWDDPGRMWATEFGSVTWDELNLIRAGENYGWPAAEGRSRIARFVNPELQWTTGEASPAGLAYLDGSLWVAALRGERLWRVRVAGSAALAKPEPLYVREYGRLRTVVRTPDGALWFTTSNRDGRGIPTAADDRIFQIRP